MVKDRFINGFLAGVSAGIVMNLWGFLAGAMRFTDLRMVDWTAIIVFGHKPPFNSIEILIALLANLFFTGLLGIGFIALLSIIKNNTIYFKGWIYSVAIWFMIYAVTTLAKVEGTMPVSVGTTTANLIGATIFGFLVAYFTVKFLSTEKSSAYRTSLAPAMKFVDDDDKDD